MLNCCTLGVCEDTTTGSDDSDSDESGRLDSVAPSFEVRFFRSNEDSVDLKPAIDGPLDKGKGGKRLSRSQGLIGALCGGVVRSATSGVIGPGKL